MNTNNIKEESLYKIYNIEIKILSPIHIGVDETRDLDPLEYVIDNETKKIHLLNIDKFIENISEEENKKFFKILSDKDLIKIRKFLYDTYNKIDITKKGKIKFSEIDVNEKFLNIYNNNIGKKDNSLIIKRNINMSNKIPYIPGSSIKGAIRTGVLEYMLSKEFNTEEKIQKINNNNKYQGTILKYTIKKYDKKKNREIEKEDITLDPLKILKVEDIILNEGDTEVTVVKNVNKKSEGIPINIEVIKPEIIKKSKILISTFFDVKLKDELLNIENILKFMSEKNKNKIGTELNNLKDILKDKYDETKEYYNNIINSIDEENKEYLLRIGFGSGFDFVTIEKLRENKKWGNSKNLIEGIIPLGFVKLKIL